MEHLKLLPEQVKTIEEKMQELLKSIALSKDDIKDKELRSAGSGAQGFDYIPDFSAFHELGRARQELAELKNILETADVIEEYNSDSITTGTRFSLTLDLGDGKIDTDEYVLVDYLDFKREDDYKKISRKSPMGKAVYGRNANEVICYTTESGRIIGGLIEEIAPSRELSLKTDLEKVKKLK